MYAFADGVASRHLGVVNRQETGMGICILYATSEVDISAAVLVREAHPIRVFNALYFCRKIRIVPQLHRYITRSTV